MGKQWFSHFAPHFWNNLSADVISADSVNSFKTRLKAQLFAIA